MELNKAFQEPELHTWPFPIEDRKEHGIANMAGPGQAVSPQHALSHCAELCHRTLASVIACVNSELDTDCPGEKKHVRA
jgi:hypothetical protein